MQEPDNNTSSIHGERPDKKTASDRLWTLVMAVFTVFFAKAISLNHLMEAGVLVAIASVVLLTGAFWEELKGRT